MNFEFSAEDRAFRQQLREFLEKEVTDEAVEEMVRWEVGGPDSRQLLLKLGEKGWLLPIAPKEYGGLGTSYLQQYITVDEVSYFLKTPVFTTAMVMGPLFMLFSDEEQKREYLPKLARGEIEISGGYTEPDAGSDLTRIKTRAVEEDDHWVINGQKIYSTAGCYATYQLVCARTDENAPASQGLSLIIVPMDNPGVTIRPMWTLANCKVGEEFYDNVRVPKKNLVGEKNKGYKHLMRALDLERVFPLPIGHMRRALEDIVEYAKETKRDGKPLTQDPLVRQELAELATAIEVAHDMAYRTVWLMDQGRNIRPEASTMKVFLTELEQKITRTGVHIMGLYGQLEPDSKHAPAKGAIEQHLLLSLYMTIGGGTSEIQRNVIAQVGLNLPRS